MKTAFLHSNRIMWKTVHLTIFIVILIHLVISFFITVPGYLLIDEAVYHLMSHSFAETKTFEIINGYREIPSIEFGIRFFFPVNGRLVSQFPNLFTIIAHPLYVLFGMRGLFLVNALSFLGILTIMYSFVMQLFDDRRLALLSLFILVFCSFFWEYSQAAWPHMLSIFFIVLAYYFAIQALWGSAPKKRLQSAFLAGLIATLAAGIRVDVIFIYFCSIFLFILYRPIRIRELLSSIIGAVPGLVILSLINYSKYKVFSPFYYGSGEKFPVYSLLIGFAIFGCTLGYALIRNRVPLQKRHVASLLTVLLILCAIFYFSHPKRMKQIIRDAYSSIIDIRTVPLDFAGPALRRSSNGGMIYTGAQKKALLQSLPYLVLIIIPLFNSYRRKNERFRLFVLFLPPLVYLCYYAYINHEYGGLCLNYRYHLPTLPFFSILVAYTIREIKTNIFKQPTLLVMIVAALISVVVHLLMTRVWFTNLRLLEIPLLTVPLWLAVILFVSPLIAFWKKKWRNNFIRHTVWILIVISMTWSASTAFLYDYRIHQAQRTANYRKGEKILEIVPSDSIFFTALHLDPFFRLMEGNNIRICFPYRDNYKDFITILEYNLKVGRRAFALFGFEKWKQMKAGLLKDYKITSIWKLTDGDIAEISYH